MSELKASNLVWKRLRNVLVTTTALAAVGGGVVYAYLGGRILLDADGVITQNRIAVSAPFDSRIKQVYVRPGDFVRAGQKIAMVESPSIARTLADLTVEKARMMARIAQLEARRNVVAALLPVAEANTEHGQSFLDSLIAARAKGLAVDKSIQELSSLQISAAERSLSLKSETAAVETELEGTQAALEEISKSYTSIKETYDNGILTAPVDGYIGSTVASVGEVLSSNSAKVAQIYSGTTFALAYLPESYLFDVEEGQKVGVKVRSRTIPATIEKVLPVTEALPPEFQLPNRVRERGQLVRISLEGKGQFAMDQKVRVTSCLRSDCKDSLTELVKAAGLNGIELAAKIIGKAQLIIASIGKIGVDAAMASTLPEPSTQTVAPQEEVNWLALRDAWKRNIEHIE